MLLIFLSLTVKILDLPNILMKFNNSNTTYLKPEQWACTVLLESGYLSLRVTTT